MTNTPVKTKTNQLLTEIKASDDTLVEYIKERWCDEVADMPMHCIDYNFEDEAIEWAADFYNSIEEIKDEILASA